MIKKIEERKNIILFNKNHERGYKSKKGIMIIEKENGDKNILDLESNTDITKSDYIEIIETKKTKKNVIFENELFK